MSAATAINENGASINMGYESDVIDPLSTECPEDDNNTENHYSEHSVLSNMLVPEIRIKEEQSDSESSLMDESNLVPDHFLSQQYMSDCSRPPPKLGDAAEGLACPLCGKVYYTTKGLNSHVVKFHKTTLGPLFKCNFCGAIEGSRASLRRHLKKKHNLDDSDHPELLTKKCSHCEMAFTSHNQLYGHLHACHKDELDSYHACPLCNALLRSKVSYVRHLKRSHPDQQDEYLVKPQCDVCGEAFENRFTLQRHAKAHHPSALHDCDECDAKFKHRYLLQRHKVTHMKPNEGKKLKEKNQLSCDICGHKYSLKGMLEKHMENVHRNPPEKSRVYKCSICQHESSSARANRNHYRQMHMRIRLKTRCTQCKLNFETQEQCVAHKKTHPKACDICGKLFHSQESLKEHSRIHEQPRHECPVCSKKFVQSSNMKRHLRVHTGERPFKCPHCDRYFSDKSACNSHSRVHTGGERSDCSICGASFSKKQRLRYHMKVHTGEGLIVCPLCEKEHTNSYPLRKHIEGHILRLGKILKNVGFERYLKNKQHLVKDTLQLMLQEVIQNYHVQYNSRGSFLKKENDDICPKFGMVNSFCHNTEIDLSVMQVFDVIDLRDTLHELDLEQKLPDHKKFGCFLIQLFKIPGFKAYECRNVGNPIRNPRKRRKRELPQTEADELVRQCLEVVIKPEKTDELNESIESIDYKMELSSEIPDSSDEEVMVSHCSDESVGSHNLST